MKSICILFSLFLFAGVLSFSGQSTFKPLIASGDTLTNTKVTQQDSLVEFAKQLLGVKYKYSGCKPDGFDCSGFVNYVFLNFGYELPRSSYEIGTIGTDVDKNSYQKGDLIFFKGSNAKSSRIGHVGIIVSEPEEELMFIHASVTNGIVITKLSESDYYKRRFLRIRRIIEPKNE